MKCPKEHCEFETVHPNNMAAHVAQFHPELTPTVEEKPVVKKTKKVEVIADGNSINEASQTNPV